MKNITSDSRNVTPGGCFIAIIGAHVDGHHYIERALDMGATTIIAQKSPDQCGIAAIYQDNNNFKLLKYPSTTWRVTQDTRLSYAQMSKAMWPHQPKHLAAVTGTNGKTSVAWFYQRLATHAGLPAASIGTLGVFSGDQQLSGSGLTTPDALRLHESLDQMNRSGIEFMVLEASSHALEQKRLHMLDLEAAAFTNFTQDHLDYHHTMEEYFLSKKRLFSEVLPPSGVAVLNVDVPESKELIDLCRARGHRLITYGLSDADITFEGPLRIMQREYIVDFQPIGHFQRYNLMAAAGMLMAAGLSPEQIAAAVPKVQAPAGRMEWIADYAGAKVLVDYAHTPDALERALQCLRLLAKKLHVVFGCGGDRDPHKRRLMGGIASRLADRVIITDDNPRTEDAHSIRKQILQGCPEGLEVPDRDAAIAEALKALSGGDILLISGKGHESHQIIGNVAHQFSDREQILEAMKSL